MGLGELIVVATLVFVVIGVAGFVLFGLGCADGAPAACVAGLAFIGFSAMLVTSSILWLNQIPPDTKSFPVLPTSRPVEGTVER